MNGELCQYRPTNPFSARRLRPGTIDFLFPPGQTVGMLIESLRASGWRGQIVGPHGSGKTTLLCSLAQPLAEAGRRVWQCALHDGRRRMPRGWTAAARRERVNFIVVDGYEQLGRLARAELRAICRWFDWGLLVTAHDDVGFPVLFRTRATLDVAKAVVEQLLADGQATISEDCIARHFETCGGDVRETLFSLYDEYECLQAARS
jgi:hypothetical protein